MKTEKEQWVADVFNSLEGSKRAVPPPRLFAKIERKIANYEAKFIPIGQYRIAMAAAVLLLVLNVFVLRQHAQSPILPSNELMTDNDQSLISDFNLYD